MQSASPVQLQRYRDFGQIISTTFQFLRQNWRPLFRAIAVICFPPGLIAGFLVGKTMGDLQGMSMRMSMPGQMPVYDDSLSQLLPMFIGYLLLTLVFVMLFAIVNEYLRAYRDGEHHGITTAELWQRSFANYGTYLGISLIYYMLMAVGMVLCILPGFYVLVVLSLAYVAHALERGGVAGSLKRSNELIRDHWWETFGLIVIVGLLQGIISYALMLPSTIVSFIVGINSAIDSAAEGGGMDMGWYSTFMSITMMVNMLVGLLTYPIMSVALALKYHSLVEEKEGAGIRQRIQGFEQA